MPSKTKLSYESYRGLPSIAGLCSMFDAMKPGLSVDECVDRLKRFHYVFKRLHQILTARLTAEPIYELKMGFSLHAYLCAEHVSQLANRVGEMREPPLGLDKVPHPALEALFDEILAAPTTEELVLGLYEKVFPQLRRALETYLEQTNPLADYPSVRVCKFAVSELKEIEDFGTKTVACLVDEVERKDADPWLALLDRYLANAGGIDGSEPNAGNPVEPRYAGKPFVYEAEPKRDERFPDPFNMGVNAETFLYDPDFPADAKVLMMFFKRLREIDVPEMMASIITETVGKPWEYYLDMTRQLWDEARHALMGEVGFVNLGVDWRKAMVNHTWSRSLNTQLSPLERHAVLYFIEQGLMPRTGKRYEWEVAKAANDPFATLCQDFDWADEVLHAHIGRKWYVSEMENHREAVAYGDLSWSKVLMDYNRWREDGLTEHRNWWPDLYLDACKRRGIEPDPKVLAFKETYETIRADLKDISMSG